MPAELLSVSFLSHTHTLTDSHSILDTPISSLERMAVLLSSIGFTDSGQTSGTYPYSIHSGRHPYGNMFLKRNTHNSLIMLNLAYLECNEILFVSLLSLNFCKYFALPFPHVCIWVCLLLLMTSFVSVCFYIYYAWQ